LLLGRTDGHHGGEAHALAGLEIGAEGKIEEVLVSALRPEPEHSRVALEPRIEGSALIV
jgi:hypothetical protein